MKSDACLAHCILRISAVSSLLASNSHFPLSGAREGGQNGNCCGVEGAIPSRRCWAKRKDALKAAGTGSEWHGLYPRGAYAIVAVEIGVFSPAVTYKTEPRPGVDDLFRSVLSYRYSAQMTELYLTTWQYTARSLGCPGSMTSWRSASNQRRERFTFRHRTVSDDRISVSPVRDSSACRDTSGR